MGLVQVIIEDGPTDLLFGDLLAGVVEAAGGSRTDCMAYASGAGWVKAYAWLAARAERDTGRVESPSSKAGPVPPAGPADEDDSLFARAFRAEMARS